MAGPELTANTDGNPWVEVFFDPDDLHADAASLRVYRFSEGRTWLTRGGVDISPGQAVLDFEVPFHTAASYRAEQFDAAGDSLGFSDLSSITVDYTGTVVHQPLEPSTLWASVTILAGSGDELVRPTDGDMIDIEGGTVGRWIGSGRRGLRRVPVSLLADVVSAETLQAMLGTYATRRVGVLCIRTSDDIRWPRTFFARGDLSEVNVNVHRGGRLIQFDSSMDEVEPPFPGLVRPLLTYGDIDAAFPSYADQDTEFATYTVKDRAYEYAGFADGGA